MQNIGEQLVGDYLRVKESCDFIDYNVYTKDSQGEIDVIGIKNKTKKVFICEVAIHLSTGLQYTKNKRPDTGARFISKFSKDIEYANKYFKGYTKEFMLWSPIVKDSKGKIEYNQKAHLKNAVAEIKRKYGVNINLMINEKFSEAISALRSHAAETSEELKSPVLRLLQIEGWLKKHLTVRNGAGAV